MAKFRHIWSHWKRNDNHLYESLNKAQNRSSEGSNILIKKIGEGLKLKLPNVLVLLLHFQIFPELSSFNLV